MSVDKVIEEVRKEVYDKIYVPTSIRNTMQELPEGPLTDKNGKKWDYILSMDMGGQQAYRFTPHIERQPIFIDLCGNPIHKGDEQYWYADGEYYSSVDFGGGFPVKPGHSPFFKYRSDCEKWVNSNVKTMTREEALRMVLNALPYLSDAAQMVRKEIEETCLPTSTNK